MAMRLTAIEYAGKREHYKKETNNTKLVLKMQPAPELIKKI